MGVFLKIEDIPKQWYNFVQDLPEPLPPALDHGNSISQTDLMRKIRPKSLLTQDKWEEKWIDIPEVVLEKLIQAGRPTELRRAKYLEKYLNTPAKIFFKREDNLVTGSFKLNTSIPQLYYCRNDGFDTVVSETGAGQWGMALALASKFWNVRCRIYMASCSFNQKPYRQHYIRLLDAEVKPSPCGDTESGRRLLEKRPDHPGSIGTAISDAIETVLQMKNAAYLSGSNVVHVLIHQTIIGLEIKKQLELLGAKPDELISCVSGGSNLCGFILPFLNDKLNGEEIRMVGIESTAAPRLTQGKYDYDYSDPNGYTPKVKSYTMGSDFIPDPIHVGGLRQHNGSPVVGLLKKLNIIDAEAYTEHEAFDAAKVFLQTEGILISPESAHAVASVIKAALKAKQDKKERNIIFVCTGNGFLDIEGYTEILLKGRKL